MDVAIQFEMRKIVFYRNRCSVNHLSWNFLMLNCVCDAHTGLLVSFGDSDSHVGASRALLSDGLGHLRIVIADCGLISPCRLGLLLIDGLGLAQEQQCQGREQCYQHDDPILGQRVLQHLFGPCQLG